jgi:hypothetical protein
MPAALPIALLLLADGAAYGPAAPAPPRAAAARPADDGCATPTPSASTRDIVICAQRPNGYRLNPDVMEARKEKREANAGRLKSPSEKAQVSGACVGPNSCVPTGPNLLAAAIGAATMAKRLAEGKEVGSMFMTTPQDDEYHLYLAAKQRREEREAEERAAAIVAAAKAMAAQAATAAPAAAKP